MMAVPPYVVFLFPSVSYVLKAEKILKERGILHKLIPVPRQIGSDCGVCLRVETGLRDAVTEALQGGVPWDKVRNPQAAHPRFLARQSPTKSRCGRRWSATSASSRNSERRPLACARLVDWNA